LVLNFLVLKRWRKREGTFIREGITTHAHTHTHTHTHEREGGRERERERESGRKRERERDGIAAPFASVFLLL
jgi:hypothetical protein